MQINIEVTYLYFPYVEVVLKDSQMYKRFGTFIYYMSPKHIKSKLQIKCHYVNYRWHSLLN